MTSLPQGLSRERLAELRGIATKATPGPWSRCGENRGGCKCGYVFGYRGEAYIAKTLTISDDVDPVTNVEAAKANQEYIAALDPTTVLALIAQCEASLSPASGTVSGEDGELVAWMRGIAAASHIDGNTRDALTKGADRLSAVLAERDGLRHDVGVEQAAADAWKALCGTAEAALAPLREFALWALREGTWDGTGLDGGDIQEKAEALGLTVREAYDPAKHGANDDVTPGDDWFVPSPLLAKHGPSET